MAKVDQIITEFEITLCKRSQALDPIGEPCYPFISGYMIGFLKQLAEEHPKVSKKIKERTETLLSMMGEAK